MYSALDTAVRTLLLPVKPGTGSEYGIRAEQILETLGITDDQADWVDLEAAAWENSGKPTKDFRDFIGLLLFSPEEDPKTFIIEPAAIGDPKSVERVLQEFATHYFKLHKRIMKEEKVNHHAAKKVLSYVHTMLLLAIGGQMTASRIYSILLADGISLGKSWQTTRSILDKCNVRQNASTYKIEAIYNEDMLAEPELLGDMKIEEAINHVAETCCKFGYTGKLHDQLKTLILEDRHNPYLCMLHFQLSLLKLYNHRLTNGYEFSPRGEGVLWLTQKYNEAGLAVGKAPFLNNAKSVDTLNAGWASSKKEKERHAARAFTDLLAELDKLSDPSRSAAALFLRALLHRIIRNAGEVELGLSKAIPFFNSETATNFIAAVGLRNTATRGIIEQRLCDCIGLFEVDDIKEWCLRGFGDSVFTTNTSRKKLGDAELKHNTEPRIIALEAHGGRLSEKYVLDHLSTMNNVMLPRIEELQGRSPLEDWSVELQFFAHAFDDGMIGSIYVCDVPVNIIYRRYADLESVATTTGLIPILNKYLVEKLNNVHVHPKVRSSVIDLSK